MEEIEDYCDALYHVKRGFLIVGFTGFTGSGCSTARRILESADLTLPGFDQLAMYHPPHDASESKASLGKSEAISQSQRNKRIYDKLKRVWNTLTWEPFVPIKVSTAIFIAAMLRSFEKENTNEILNQIRKLMIKDRERLEILKELWASEKPKDKLSERIIEGYELADNTYDIFKKKFGGRLGELTKLMQDFGDELRSYGMVAPDSSLDIKPGNLFVLPEALRRIISAYRNARDAKHFVIDAFRNPFEIEFFKWRYSEFYLVAVLRRKTERWLSLDLLQKDREDLEKRESKSEDRSSENIQQWIISQDIEECLTKADVYVENPQNGGGEYPYLKYHLIKLICLAKSPGCIPPTQDERSMQMAMTARQMSGCISRRVGAVVIDQAGYLKGFGWNDPPKGQPPCALRTSRELLENPNRAMFSKYEMSEEFKSHIKNNCNPEHPFCFRNEFAALNKDEGYKEYTRALHAEENAILQALENSKSTLEGSTLYTTDQPCTLCAKKAYHLGVDRVVYIQEYPGIGIEQTFEAGTRSISTIRFQGIVGSAYFRLFSSLMPEKDIIQLNGAVSNKE